MVGIILSITFLAMLEPAPNANPSLRVCIREGGWVNGGTTFGRDGTTFGRTVGTDDGTLLLVGEVERGIL